MASTAKCPFCGAVVTSDQKQCPDCGADNLHYVEDRPERIVHPETIDELKEYCAERGMPLLRMRFFIGEDFREPRAFGIYRDKDIFIVYKNKADGSRAVRYRGPDEKYAVNELWSKLLQECHNRGIYPDGRNASGNARTVPAGYRQAGSDQSRQRLIYIRRIILISVIALFAVAVISSMVNEYALSKPLSRGYYRWNNTYYYTESSRYSGSEWYSYDSTGWKRAATPTGPIRLHLSYRGDTVSPEWGIREIPLHEEPEKGYYQYGSLYYCDEDTKWHIYDTSAGQWLGSSAPEASGKQAMHLLFLSDYYLGPDFREDMPGFDCLTVNGYYRKNGKTWYYNGLWYLYDGKGWKKADSPDKMVSSYYEGEEFQEGWGIRAFLTGSPQYGYYRYEDQAYYYSYDPRSGTRWAVFDKGTGRWGHSKGLPEYDTDGYLLYPEDHYGGESFPAEWEGRDYDFREGYYCYQGATYYFSIKSPERWNVFNTTYQEQLYRYENGWRRSGYPVGNLSSCYEGTDLQKEWGCTAFRLPEWPERGYYRWEDSLFYAISTSVSWNGPWYQFGSGSWRRSSFPVFDADDYLVYPEDHYLGTEYSAEWGGQEFHVSSGYYRINDKTYYRTGRVWYSWNGYYNTWTITSSSPADDYDDYFSGETMPEHGKDFNTWQNERNSKINSRDSNDSWWSDRWNSSDYDDWDIGDTDWDSDW